jgi:hypothetical protein
MATSNKTVFFDPSLNGLGDCIVGCSSAFVLSQVLNMQFKILNGSIGIYSYFDIPLSYQVVGPLRSLQPRPQTVENHVSESSGSNGIRNILYNRTPAEDAFWLTNDLSSLSASDLVVSSCMNFGRFIYRNPHVSSRLTMPETNVINYLFKNILLPHPAHLQRFVSLQKELKMEDAICVHLRCDDVWEDSNSGEARFVVNPTIRRFARCIKQCRTEDQPVILISDHADRVVPIFADEDIKCSVIPGETSHSSKCYNIDYAKTILDIMTIGACRTSIISYWSNFSRIGVLRTLITPWIVQPELQKNSQHSWDFNVDIDSVEFRQARLEELLSKERMGPLR